MNPGRFYLPNMGANFGSMMRTGYLPTRGGGLFSSITRSLKSFNWGGLLNGANKTLNVVNQTIPLVRQAGPMLNNMKSMMRIARAFGSETNNNLVNSKNTRVSNKNDKNNVGLNNNNNNKNLVQKKEVLDNNYPNFFI